MKRKTLLIVMIVSLLIMTPKIKSLAGETYIKSKGNIEGVINFYSEDIRYLSNEIENLISECKQSGDMSR